MWQNLPPNVQQKVKFVQNTVHMYRKMENLYAIKYKKWKNVEFICDNIQKKATPEDGSHNYEQEKLI